MMKKMWTGLAIAACAAIIGAAVVYTQALAIVLAIGAVAAVALIVAIVRNPLFGIYATAFFLPFEHLGSLEIGGSTLRVSQVVAAVMIVAWIAAGLMARRLVLRRNTFAFPAALFVCTQVISLVNAPNLTRALQVLVFVLFVMAVAFVIPQLIVTRRHLEQVVKALFVTAALVCMFGLFQFAGDVVGLPTSLTGLRPQYTKAVFGFPRIQSTALEPLYFANFLLIPTALACALYLGRVYWVKRSLLLALIGLFVLNIVLTLSRGGFVGLAGVGAVLAVYYVRRIFTLRNVAAAGLVLVVVLGAAQAFLNFSGLPKALDIFTAQATNYQEGAGIVERFSTYGEALRLFDRHPWIGVGIGNFGPSVARVPFVEPRDGWAIVNNEMLEILAETGVLGLAAFCLLCYALVRSAVAAIARVRTGRSDADPTLRAVLIGLLAALVGIFAQYQTFSTLYVLHIWFVIGLVMAAVAIADSEAKGVSHEVRRSK